MAIKRKKKKVVRKTAAKKKVVRKTKKRKSKIKTIWSG